MAEGQDLPTHNGRALAFEECRGLRYSEVVPQQGTGHRHRVAMGVVRPIGRKQVQWPSNRPLLQPPHTCRHLSFLELGLEQVVVGDQCGVDLGPNHGGQRRELGGYAACEARGVDLSDPNARLQAQDTGVSCRQNLDRFFLPVGLDENVSKIAPAITFSFGSLNGVPM